ncbi:MAG TPA: diacylglycerol kinase family protein [Propionicimonas sp.]|uniref:diacylglycerol/lipid kinase family protein n=1 Tax=Propionicimonas sp. TaxID=1955623 RepID=UPI002F40CD45
MPDTPRLTAMLAVIVNPSKFTDLEAVRSQITEGCRAHGQIEVHWYETSVDDPGAGQARQALKDGATLVCSLGGDGTVRSVASALVGTDVPLGLLPGGTGNLLARNLDLPVDDLDAALATALTGVDRRIDAGAVSWDDGPEEVFVVMAGMGMDATMMGEADERIKDAVGWPAYLLSGAKALFDPGFAVTAAGPGQSAHSRRARMVVVGNCGELTGGLRLLPEARLDDGELDMVVVAPRGVVGWFAVVRELLTSRRSDPRAVRHLASDRFDLRANRPVGAEVDGDAVGERRRMQTRTLPGALVVREARPQRGAEAS